MTTEHQAAVDDRNNFRQRLLSALEESIAEEGYQKTTVADIVRRARTSRRTFYEHFDGREACFLALLGDAYADQVRQISAAVDPNSPWQVQVRQAVEAWISSSTSRSALMLSSIRDLPALGAAARDLQREVIDNFVTMVQALGDTGEFHSAGVGPVSRLRAVMLLGGLRELTAVTAENGGAMTDITDEAVAASIALLRPDSPSV
ncbi:TetR/AcrR family transcriptional regulator [Mycolicibacterium sp. F2034L]|uniref:TetR/AcrR family transcriptional regulator n=1 Tax=Mycolicibacterium sp. F2034L TaxID=2926422 RepID=UPI001FF49555|nr:TetR/AcrR family transcriptional regulator [Mycolicibacterium sp. F2034L]MCK0172631.1 TetR/AcrR family transcriptional regulator [Mycolicibacterium sp. F2034L]